MTILWHMPTLQTSGCGLSHRAVQIARRLRQSGMDITFCVAADRTDVGSASIDGVPVCMVAPVSQIPLHWSLQSRARLRAARALVARLDAVHDLFVSCQPDAVIAYRSIHPRRPIIFVCGGTTLLHDAAESREQSGLPFHRRVPFILDRALKHQTERRAYRAADASIFDSHHTRNRLIDTYGIPDAQCHTVHGGVDPNRFATPTPAQRAAARDQLALGDNEIAITWTGRLSPEKNVELLIRAMPNVRHPMARLVLAGDGPLRDALTTLVNDLNLTRVVRFLGRQPDVLRTLHAADIFAFPSRGESFGGSLVEAMACGLPAIALQPDGNAIRNAIDEIFDHGTCGLSVTPATPAAFAAAIDRLAADTRLRRDLGAKAAARAVAQFTWDAAASQMSNIIESLTQSRPIPQGESHGSDPARDGTHHTPVAAAR